MPAHLTLASKPYKSSHLAIPPSPFSPKFPITQLGSPPPVQRTKSRPRIELPTPPPEPLHWLWQCHMCNRIYRLGVTRRCLDDGHFFCAGTTTVKRSKRTGYKKTIRHKACASEFDYQGWKAWSTWRRDVAEQIEAAAALEEFLNDQPMSLTVPSVPDGGQWMNGLRSRNSSTKKSTRDYWAKDCWNTCDYPSECRWGKQYGVATPVVSNTATASTQTPEPKAVTSFDDILLDVEPPAADPMSTDEVEPLSSMDRTTPEEGTKKPSMDDLLESAKRRKRRSAGQLPSPLASHPPSPSGPESPDSAQMLEKALDDFDIHIRRSFERAGAMTSSYVSNARNSAALEDEKAKAFVAGLKPSKKKFSGLW